MMMHRRGQITSNFPHTSSNNSSENIMTITVLTFALFVGSSLAQSPALPRSLGSMKLANAAFMEAYKDQGEEYTLYVSTFNPINGQPDPVYYLRNLGGQLMNVSNWQLEEMGKVALWPNSPERIPLEVFGVEAIIQTSGFLVPPKTHGALHIYDTSLPKPKLWANIASVDVNDWSYHRVLWKDMDGDGDLDALTARFHKPILGQTLMELLWLENPSLPIYVTPVHGWIEHILKTQATDVHFRNFKLTSKGQEVDCILSAEFFSERLVLYYTLDGDWRNWTNVQNITLDDTLGQTFDVYVDDFNKDGKLDLMATAYNHTHGHVFVWEVPEDFTTGMWTKHTIADGFIANNIIGGQSMTPGSPKPFYPTVAYEEEGNKPYIMLSGDDDGKHYILEPMSQSPTEWSYEKHVLVDTAKTTSGKFAVADFNGDGYTDIIAAGYTAGEIYAFTYAPEM